MSLINIKSGISIVIPTYNGEKVIQMALEGILNQKFQMPLEVILINNNSFDGTIVKAKKYWDNNKTNIDFKILSEDKPGKFFAQHLGILSASFNYVLICDDDNIIDENYCQIAFNWLEKNSEIAAIGGCGRPLFESSEPTWFQTYHKLYAVGAQGDESGDITDKKGCLYGAGMVIRKDIYIELFNRGFEPLFSSRKGNKLASGSEDTELCYAFRLMGYKIFYDSNLTFNHFLELRKLTKSYLYKLVLSQAKVSANALVYENLLYNKSFFNLWINNLKIIFTLEFYKNLFFFLTDYKKMKIHSICFLVSFMVLLRARFLLLNDQRRKLIQVFS
jgi:glycosyltransferase involved in cell wall biosynthesis